MCLAIPGKITEFVDDKHFALVEVSGVRRKVNVDLLVEEDLKENDWVLLHVGFAMNRLDEEEAQRTLGLLRELGQVQEELDALKATP